MLVEKLGDLNSIILLKLKARILFAKKAIDKGYGTNLKEGFNIEFKEYIKTLDSKERNSALKKYKK